LKNFRIKNNLTIREDKIKGIYFLPGKSDNIVNYIVNRLPIYHEKFIDSIVKLVSGLLANIDRICTMPEKIEEHSDSTGWGRAPRQIKYLKEESLEEIFVEMSKIIGNVLRDLERSTDIDSHTDIKDIYKTESGINNYIYIHQTTNEIIDTIASNKLNILDNKSLFQYFNSINLQEILLIDGSQKHAFFPRIRFDNYISSDVINITNNACKSYKSVFKPTEGVFKEEPKKLSEASVPTKKGYDKKEQKKKTSIASAE
jgi:hypothetical protein